MIKESAAFSRCIFSAVNYFPLCQTFSCNFGNPDSSFAVLPDQPSLCLSHSLMDNPVDHSLSIATIHTLDRLSDAFRSLLFFGILALSHCCLSVSLSSLSLCVAPTLLFLWGLLSLSCLPLLHVSHLSSFVPSVYFGLSQLFTAFVFVVLHYFLPPFAAATFSFHLS